MSASKRKLLQNPRGLPILTAACVLAAGLAAACATSSTPTVLSPDQTEAPQPTPTILPVSPNQTVDSGKQPGATKDQATTEGPAGSDSFGSSASAPAATPVITGSAVAPRKYVPMDEELENQRAVEIDLDEFRQLLPRDAIKPVYEPRFIKAFQTDMRPDELVIGVEINGESKAYPVALLNRREMETTWSEGCLSS